MIGSCRVIGSNLAETLLKLGPNVEEYDSIVLAVAHDNYKALNITKSEKQVLFDIKSVLANSKSDGDFKIKVIFLTFLYYNYDIIKSKLKRVKE